MSDNNQQITDKIILKATLKSVSPFLVGKGGGDEADVDTIMQNGKPYIPASSLAGALRARVHKNYEVKNEVQENYFWGTKSQDNSENISQSHIIFQDLLPNENAKITVRDGVRIVNKTGVAELGAKYDYQCVEPGIVFPFSAEITIRKGFEKDFFKQMAQTIGVVLKEDFRIGAFTTTGFGRMECVDFNIYHFKFPGNATNWFQYLNEGTLPENTKRNDIKAFPKREDQAFQITANFNINNALMVGTYGINPNEADKKHIRSNNEPVLPGKSIKGALRHRALKILKTLTIPDPESKLKKLMGWVNPDSKEEAQKSRLFIEEAKLQNVEYQLQNRIKIDRFTGGAMSGALFNSEPVWKKDGQSVTLNFKIEQFKDEEAGLLLLLLKDLWNEDLPIGGEKNIGRGILSGIDAEIKYRGNTVKLVKQQDGLSLSNKEEREELEAFVSALNKLKEKETEANYTKWQHIPLNTQ